MHGSGDESTIRQDLGICEWGSVRGGPKSSQGVWGSAKIFLYTSIEDLVLYPVLIHDSVPARYATARDRHGTVRDIKYTWIGNEADIRYS